MNIQPLLEALDVQEDAARALADDLRGQITELQGRLREAETHLEHLAITRKTVTALADRLPAQAASADLPEHPRTTPASSPPSTRPPAPSGPATSAKPSTTNCCRRTSKAPAPS
ncbi:hypothetical protein OH738_01500 [Streptomyces hirsutus]|uniref:hypothetical protein n=1 Tax=Streptomyces hirsutus TaxID=35620 RepID=UPI0038637CF7|nr:hypothetical protein OH738_00760 [Streptomyces hirsutus]WTD15650.1 hypothetical protein OH738_01500 [Streptomyces hirsutus]